MNLVSRGNLLASLPITGLIATVGILCTVVHSGVASAQGHLQLAASSQLQAAPVKQPVEELQRRYEHLRQWQTLLDAVYYKEAAAQKRREAVLTAVSDAGIVDFQLSVDRVWSQLSMVQSLDNSEKLPAELVVERENIIERVKVSLADADAKRLVIAKVVLKECLDVSDPKKLGLFETR